MPEASDWSDLFQASFYGGELMSWEELFNLIDMTPESDITQIFNALLNIQKNPKFKALPEKERIKALSTAASALSNLRFG